MIKYKKLKIKNEEDIEELDIKDIEPLKSFGDIQFKKHLPFINTAIVYAFWKNELKGKVAKLNKKVNWIIREYEGELYLIPLKKDC